MSKTTLDQAFAYQVLSIVEEIPEGLVATYGQIAQLMGHPKNARQVARVLSHAHLYGSYPCHRVVNHAGRPAPGWPEQMRLLEQEGVTLSSKNRVDLQRFQWTAE